MSIQQEVKEKIKGAMKERKEVELAVYRGLSSAFTNELVAQKRPPQEELSDKDALSVIRKAVKQRKDSIEQFTKGGRPELAESEKAELAVLETLLPPQMSKEEVKKVAKAKITELGITDKSKIGMIIGHVKKDLEDAAEGEMIKLVIEELLEEMI